MTLSNVPGNEFKPLNKKQYSPKKGHYVFLPDEDVPSDMLQLSSFNQYYEQGDRPNTIINHV